MMKIFLLLLTIFSLTFLSAQDKHTELLGFVKDELSEKEYPKNTQLAIGFIDGDEEISIGLIKKRKWKEAENANSIFEIGSISKVFTSHLLAEAVELGLLNLNDTIQQDLDIDWKVTEPITYQMLANHTSGLPRLPSNLFKYMAEDPSNPYVKYDTNALVNYLENEMKLQASPGEEYDYSNLGAGLLGFLVCQKMNLSYEQALQKYLFEDLKMWSSSTVLENYTENALVEGLNISGTPAGNWDFNILAGAGAIKSNCSDMLKFMNLQLSDTSDAVQLMQKKTYESDEIDLALGWHIIKEKEYLWHNGATGGYRSSLVLDPKTKRGVIILSNISYAHPNASFIDQLVFELINELR